MKIKVNLKIILILLTVVALFVIPTHVFAAEDLNDFWDTNTGWEDITDGTGSEGTGTENTGSSSNTGTGTQENGTGTSSNNGTGTTTNTGTGSTNNAGTSSNTNQNNNNKPESYDKAGIAEDTIMVIAIIALVMTAICAYKKVNDYKGI